MGEVLSQNEIDSLLQALSSGELDADEMSGNEEIVAKNYDFKRPAKFSKDHLRTLEIIFEHYGRLISTNLPVYLRKNIQVNDFVVLGNRCGRVIEVFTNGKVTGITVYEDMRYLPLDYRTTPGAFGYDDDATKQGRTITYRFGRDTTRVEGPNENGSNVVLFQGTMMVLRQATDDRNTWNSVAQAAALYSR